MVIEDVGNRKSDSPIKSLSKTNDLSWPQSFGDKFCVKSPKSNAAAVAVWSRTWNAQSSACRDHPRSLWPHFGGQRSLGIDDSAASILGNDRAPNQWSWAHFNGAHLILDPD